MYVNKSTFAKAVNVTPASITKAVRKGVLNSCLSDDGKSIHLENGKKIYKHYSSATKNHSKKQVINKSPKNTSPQDTKIAQMIENSENIEELKELLEDEDMPPLMKVQTIRGFWESKISQKKAELLEDDTIYIKEAKAALESILSPFNQFLDDLPNNLKNHFPEIDYNAIDWMSNEINRQKEELGRNQWAH